METRRRLPGLLLLLCLLPRAPAQGDFDLADALDDPEPTPKPGSDIYPKPRPPHGPQPANPDSGGNIYPRPKPQPRPQPGSSDNSGGGYHHNDDDGRYPPRPRPPAGGGGGGGGYSGGHGDYGHTDGASCGRWAAGTQMLEFLVPLGVRLGLVSGVLGQLGRLGWGQGL
uniref:glycoprotein Xg n=1 Tax=Ictidomys tridecemlineatus TaxID=43179 RepID=UPI001A9F3691|nr:glycoprotein Xg [Ictidomys tridecemlineatus]